MTTSKLFRLEAESFDCREATATAAQNRRTQSSRSGQGSPLPIAELVEAEQRMITVQRKWPLYAVPSYSPWVGFTLRSMSSNRIHARASVNPGDPLAAQLGHGIQGRRLRDHLRLEAAHLAGRGGLPITAPRPTTQPIARSCASQLASFTSSYPANRPKTDCRNCATTVWRPFLPVRVSARTSLATALRPSAEFAEGEQPTIGRDPRAAEFQLEALVETQPKTGFVALHPPPLPSQVSMVALIAL
jgi:hypothetical protein